MKFRYLGLAAIAAATIFGLASCKNEKPAVTTNTTEASNKSVDSDGTLSYSEYVAKNDGDEVCIDAYITGKQSWWNNMAVIYLADDNGAYFAYNLACTEEQYNTELKIGNNIKVSGEKTTYNGQVEVMNPTYVLLTGTKLYDAKTVTADKIGDYPSQKVKVENLTVVSFDTNAESVAAGNDLYYTVTDGTTNYQYAVESYLTNKETQTYKTVKDLKAGDVITVEGFVYYWYTAQIQTTAITVTQKAA